MADGMLTPSSGSNASFNNEMAEIALLGALLTKPELLDSLPPTFDPRHYNDAVHTDIHTVLIEVGQPGVPAGLAVMQALAGNDRNLSTYISSLITGVVSFSKLGIQQYAAIVTDQYRRRGLLQLAENIKLGALSAGKDETVDLTLAKAITSLDELTTQHPVGRQGMRFDDALDAALAQSDRAAKGDGVCGLSTGFRSIDARIGGLEPGTLTVMAGRPGMGKSVIGHQIAVNAARQGTGVLEISLEMSAPQLAMRSLSVASGIPLKALKRGQHDPGMHRLLAARRELQNLPLSIEDGSGLTVGSIALKARSARRTHGLGLLMIDHLHIVRPDDGDVKQGATWAVGQVSGALKRLAKTLDVPILVLAQLNRGVEGRDDKRPGLADLRQTGNIEQDADAVGFIYRPEYYLGAAPEQNRGETREAHANKLTRWEQDRRRLNGKAELIFAKVRDGSTGTVALQFNAETTSFSEPEDGA